MENLEIELFGLLLKQFRTRQKLTQTELANNIGKQSRGSIQAWETGVSLPQEKESVHELARVLRLTASETDRLLLAAHHPQKYYTLGIRGVQPELPEFVVDLSINERAVIPVILLSMYNRGQRTLFLTRMQISVLAVAEFLDCDDTREDDTTRAVVPISATYSMKLSASLKGKQVVVPIAHHLRSDEADRFQVHVRQHLDDPAVACSWYYLKITLLDKALEQTLDVEPLLISIPPVDEEWIDHLWPSLSSTPCSEQNTMLLRTMSQFTAHRSLSVDTTIRRILEK